MLDLSLSPYIREASYAIREPCFFPERRLLDYLLVVIERGACRFVVEDRPYLLGPDQVFLAQPGDRITLQGITDAVTPYLHCDIVDQPGRDERFSPGPGFLDLTPYQHLVQPRVEELLGATIPSVIDVPDPVAFRDQLVTCIGLWRSGTALNRMEAHALLASLFVIIWRAHLADQPIASQVPSALHHLDGYLRHHLPEQITLQKMAEQVGFSVPHLIRLCRRQWNHTPHQHLQYLRLQHSLLLLQNVDLSITRVASYCGFADTQHFVHVFRKHFNLTPTQTRAAAAGSSTVQLDSDDGAPGMKPLALPLRATANRGGRRVAASRESLLSLAR